MRTPGFDSKKVQGSAWGCGAEPIPHSPQSFNRKGGAFFIGKLLQSARYGMRTPGLDSKKVHGSAWGSGTEPIPHSPLRGSSSRRPFFFSYVNSLAVSFITTAIRIEVLSFGKHFWKK